MMKLDPEKISRWYRCGLWTAKMLDDAVAKGSLTKTQANKIKREAAT